MRLTTTSEAETESLGERLGGALSVGSIVGLVGPLGAGKTAMVRGIARACGVDDRDVHSPTFLTAAEYTGDVSVAHIDLYRHAEVSPDPEWLAELLDGSGVAVVEWFELLPDRNELDAVLVEIDPGPGDQDRRVSVVAQGERAKRALDALRKDLA